MLSEPIHVEELLQWGGFDGNLGLLLLGLLGLRIGFDLFDLALLASRFLAVDFLLLFGLLGFRLRGNGAGASRVPPQRQEQQGVLLRAEQQQRQAPAQRPPKRKTVAGVLQRARQAGIREQTQ